MSFDLPPVIQKAECVRAMVEAAVATWTRDHRYAHGIELRRQAKELVKSAHFAWTDRANRAARLAALSDAIDEIKMDLRLGQHIKCFRSFGQFEAVMRETRYLGQQCGALKRATARQHSKGQNATASRAAAACPDTEYPGRLVEANR